MKGYLLILLVFGATLTQAAPKADDSKSKEYDSKSPDSPWFVPEHHKDDLHVNLKTYHDGNTTIGKELKAEIAEKKKLVEEGETHAKNLHKVTNYVTAWNSDIAATEKAVENFHGDAQDTRDQWTTVKQTQEPKEVKRVTEAHPEPKYNVRVVKNGAKKANAKNFKLKMSAKHGGVAKKGKAPKAKKAVAKKPAAKKAMKAAPKKPAAKKVAKVRDASKQRRLQAMQNKKTLESVNRQYSNQVKTLTKNINEVIRKIVQVYKRANATDAKAADQQEKMRKTMAELKDFLKHLLEYISWTEQTMHNYAQLFHTKPKNEFLKQTRKLQVRIKMALRL